MERIIVYGNINHDTEILLDEFKQGVKNTGRIVYSGLGGGGANAAYWLTKKGRDPLLVGNVGNDYFGKIVKRELERKGIRNQVKIRKDRTGFTTIILSGKQKTMVKALGANKRPVPVKRAEYALIEGNPNTPVLLDRLDAFTFLDPGSQNLSITILNKADYVRMNNDEYRALGWEARKLKPKILFVSGKTGGGTLYYKGEKKKFKPLKQDFKDSTGAGDYFTAMFAHSYIRTQDVVSSAEFALKKQAEKVSFYGPQKN